MKKRLAALVLGAMLLPAAAVAFGGGITIHGPGQTTKGASFSLSGQVTNDNGRPCESGRKVRILRMSLRKRRRVVNKIITHTGASGHYSVALKEYRTRRYRASAVAAPTCGKQDSGTITVRLATT